MRTFHANDKFESANDALQTSKTVRVIAANETHVRYEVGYSVANQPHRITSTNIMDNGYLDLFLEGYALVPSFSCEMVEA